MSAPSLPPQFSLQLLQEYIELQTLIQAKKPEEIRVSQQVFNWYRDQRKSVAKNFNMGDIPSKDTDMSFMGTKLVAILEVA